MLVKLEFIDLGDGVSVASILNWRIICFFRYIMISHLVIKNKSSKIEVLDTLANFIGPNHILNTWLLLEHWGSFDHSWNSTLVNQPIPKFSPRGPKTRYLLIKFNLIDFEDGFLNAYNIYYLVQVRFTLHLRDQQSMWLQDGCKVYMDSYMASNESCFIITWSLGLFSKTTFWR